MKFSFKITIFSFLIIVLSLGLGGFLIIYSTFANELDINLNSATSNNQFLSTIYYSIANNNLGTYTEDTTYLLKEFQAISNNGQVFIGDVKDIKYYDQNNFINQLEVNEQGSQIIDVGNIKYIQVITKLKIEENDVYLENLIDISKIYDLRDKNYRTYCFFLVIISMIGSFITYLFSVHITRPLNIFKQTARIITGGNLSERIPTNTKEMQSPEFIYLAKEFNHMAEKLENYIEELKNYNQRQDDFISRFTHELKTPLTSIIGYAEILRTYETSQEKKYELASYIYKEGKRLGDLSHHLLQLIMLKKDDFILKRQSAYALFHDVKSGVAPLLEKYDVKLVCDIDKATLLVETTLLKSLLYNLIDNSCKASTANSIIEVIGKKVSNNGKTNYQITVKDYGKGIPKESLDKVTTPFYMVDKSRSRKQGGAGIGLSLCEQIANIHHSTLKIDSVCGEYTKISFEVEVDSDEK